MENPELENIKHVLYESLVTSSDSLSKSKDEIVKSHGKPDSFSSALVHPNSTEICSSLSKMSAELAKNLEMEMEKIVLTDDFPTEDIHLSLNLLSEFDQECEQQEALIEKKKQEIENIQKKTKQFLNEKKEMEEIVRLREEKGEMLDQQPCNLKELKIMENKVKTMFNLHREKLKQLVPQLFPNDKNQMRELLALLTKSAVEGGGEFVNLESFPSLKTAAMVLVQCDILYKHPHDPQRVRLCILD